jgi:hypothetical protein
MEKAINYLNDNSSISGNEIVNIDAERLSILIKIIQLETLIEFVQINYPEEIALLHTFQFELKGLLRNEKIKEQLNEEDNISF